MASGQAAADAVLKDLTNPNLNEHLKNHNAVSFKLVKTGMCVCLSVCVVFGCKIGGRVTFAKSDVVSFESVAFLEVYGFFCFVFNGWIDLDCCNIYSRENSFRIVLGTCWKLKEFWNVSSIILFDD